MGFVVDASVCAKWFFEEEHHALARRLPGSGEPLHAPELLASEVGSIVWKRCVRGEITPAEGADVLSALGALPIELAPTGELAVAALELGCALGHSFYDCLYLALARREGVPLVTADGRLRRKLAGTAHAGLVLWIEDLP